MTTKPASITVSLGSVTLTRTRTSSGGKDVYEVKGVDLPNGGKLYVQAYVPPAENAPALATPAAPKARKATRKDLSEPATPAPSTPSDPLASIAGALAALSARLDKAGI